MEVVTRLPDRPRPRRHTDDPAARLVYPLWLRRHLPLATLPPGKV